MQHEIYNLLSYTGKALTLVKVSAGSYSVSTSQNTATETDYSCIGHLLNYKDSEIDGSIITKKDRKAVISAENLAVTPLKGDRLKEGSTKYEIQSVQKITKGSTTIAYICQVRI